MMPLNDVMKLNLNITDIKDKAQISVEQNEYTFPSECTQDKSTKLAQKITARPQADSLRSL